MKKIILFLRLPMAAILAIYGLVAVWPEKARGPNIRVGVLHALTGPMAPAENPMVDALFQGIEQANAGGGINGQQIEAVLADCGSDTAYCARQAERLIDEEKVSALFGCGTSLCRRAVKPVVEKHQNLLFYAMNHEGMEVSPNIVYTGATPNQQLIPGLRWALDKLGKRFYIVGSDYIFSRMSNVMAKDLLLAQNGSLAGERYLTPGGGNVDALVADIVKQRPDVVLNTLYGDSNGYFFAALKKAGLTRLPLVSLNVDETSVKAWGGSQLEQHYAALTYFQTLPSAVNQDYIAAFQARYGAERTVADSLEASFVGFRLWLQAAREADSADPVRVQRTILRQTLNAPEGMVAIDQDTRHLWKTPRIGKVRPDGQFDIVWDAEELQEPVPFPSYRMHDEWLEMLDAVERGQR